MSAKKRVLGRGLDALLGPGGPPTPPAAAPAPVLAPAAPAEGVRKVPFVRLRPNPFQPRSQFRDEALDELCASIRANGILQPIIVRQRGEDYEIVAGERRWRAAQRAELTEVPVVVREFDDREMLELALLENLQREDLNPVEEARAYQRLIEEFHLTQEEVAERMGKSRVAVTNAVRLLRLPEAILQWVAEGRLSAGHARALLALENDSARLALAREIQNRGYSVRETEKRVRLLLKAPSDSAKSGASPRVTTNNSGALADLEEKLSLHLGARVRLVSESNNRGRIEIYFGSLDEFQAVLDRFGLPVEQEI